MDEFRCIHIKRFSIGLACNVERYIVQGSYRGDLPTRFTRTWCLNVYARYLYFILGINSEKALEIAKSEFSSNKIQAWIVKQNK